MKRRGRNVANVGGMIMETRENPEKILKITTLFTTSTTLPAGI